jgi:DNA (cytosine-5)-methyltransferase 1
MSKSLTYLSLFTGIGGLDLGLDKAGMECVGQVERIPFCRTVLDEHWPEVPKHDDVRTAPAWWRSGARPVADLVAGGFPCQPFSKAGRRRGVADERWGWPWMADVIRLVRPRYVLVENVAALILDSEAFGWLLGDLATLGFDAEWAVLSACTLGAPHTRERLFVVAYPHGLHGAPGLGLGEEAEVPAGNLRPGTWADPLDGLMAAAGRVGGVADGLPDWLEPARVTALGNAVVPHVGEFVGRLIVEHASRELATTN